MYKYKETAKIPFGRITNDALMKDTIRCKRNIPKPNKKPMDKLDEYRNVSTYHKSRQYE
jgi:hypothetical protein